MLLLDPALPGKLEAWQFQQTYDQGLRVSGFRVFGL